MKFKLQKIHIITISLLILGFITCTILGFTVLKTPELLNSDIKSYKYNLGLSLFLHIIPALIATSAVIGWSIDFGKNQEGSRLRFSPAMTSRFKSVMINSLIAVLILTLCGELFESHINYKLQKLKQKPVLLQEYQDSAEQFYEEGLYETCYRYARLAFQMEQTNPENRILLDKAEKALNQSQQRNTRVLEEISSIGQDQNLFGNNVIKQRRLTEPFTSYTLLKNARQCLKEEDWFGAHYYSQTALQAINPKDINILELKDISAKSWNQISKARAEGSTEAKRIYAKKIEGYTAILENDNLKAYYIFKTLYDSSKKLSLDPDVIRYLKIAEQNLTKQYFFIDETFNLQGFEQANNVHFSVFNPVDGSTNLYYIKGITSIGSDKSVVQYLRGMTIVNIDATGKYRSGYYVPYGRMTNIQTQYFSNEIKEELGIDNSIKVVPYILLRSVDRKNQGVRLDPIFKGGYDKTVNSSYIILPIEFSDFDLLKKASTGASTMDLLSLIKFVPKAEPYGFSLEVFEQESMKRLLSPLFYLVLMILLAWTAWHGRTDSTSLFKFHWIIMFPLLSLAFIYLYSFSMRGFMLANYALFSIFGVHFAIIAGIILYIILLIVVSIMFLACHNTEGE